MRGRLAYHGCRRQAPASAAAILTQAGPVTDEATARHMIRIVDRYLARETALTVAAVTGVLMLIMLSNKFASLLGDAAAGRLPRETVFTLLGLASIKFFIYVVPVAAFLAVMLALGRLYRDSEMTTLMACGVGPAQIYRPLLVIGVLLAIGLGALSLYASPWAERMTRIVNSAGAHSAEVGSFESGRFKVDDNGQGALYADHVSKDGRLLDKVFMQGPSGDLMAVVIADSGHRQDDPKQPSGGMLILDNGWRYEGLPGQADYRLVKFAEHGIVISPAKPDNGLGSYDAYPTADLGPAGDQPGADAGRADRRPGWCGRTRPHHARPGPQAHPPGPAHAGHLPGRRPQASPPPRPGRPR